MPEFKLAEAFVEIGMKGEAAFQQKLNQQKLAIDRMFESVKSGQAQALISQAQKLAGYQQKIASQINLEPAETGPKTPSLGSQAFGMLGKGIGSLAGPAGLAIAAVNQGLELVKKIGDMILDVARAANPIMAERFDYAMRDLWAVIGRNFVPVLETATKGVRALADIIDHLGSNMFGLKEAMGGINFILDKLPKGNSFGAGDFRTPSLVGIAEAKNQFMTEALRVSAGGKQDPAMKTAENTGQAVGLLAQIVGALTGNSGMLAAGTAVSQGAKLIRDIRRIFS